MKSVAVASLLALVAPLAAQSESKSDRKQRIKARIEQMREQMRDGERTVRTNVRIVVRLNNGNKLRGVIKNSRFIERVDGLDFVPADKATPGAGVRVWYSDNTDSYVFLQHEMIRSYKIGARLSDMQIREIEERIASDRQRAEKARALRLAKRAAEQKTKEDADNAKALADAEKGKGEADKEQTAEEKRLAALLEEFPPDQGWGADKIAEIRQRVVVVGVPPDAKGKRFIEVYGDWQRAVEIDTRRKASEMEKKAAANGGRLPSKASSPTPGK